MKERDLQCQEWFQWAPSNNFLGYIQGFNREAIKNKELKVTEIDKNINSQYTPKGYVDRDFTWQTDNSIFVHNPEKVIGLLLSKDQCLLYIR